MFEQLSSVVLVLGIVQLTKYLNLGDAEYLPLVRSVYAISTAIILIGHYLLYRQIVSKPNEMTITAKVQTSAGIEKKKMTITEYDMDQFKKMMQQQITSIVIIVGIHLYFGFSQPLILQSILPYRNFLTSPLCQIHLFGKSTTSGKLRRPFPDPNPFAQALLEQQEKLQEKEKKKELDSPKIVELTEDEAASLSASTSTSAPSNAAKRRTRNKEE